MQWKTTSSNERHMDDSTKTKRQVSIGQVHAGGGIDPGGVLSSRPDFYRFLLDHFPDAV